MPRRPFLAAPRSEGLPEGLTDEGQAGAAMTIYNGAFTAPIVYAAAVRLM